MLLPFGLNLGENAPILSANQELRDQLDLLHEEGGVAKFSATCWAVFSTWKISASRR